jgi:hypothetical protein
VTDDAWRFNQARSRLEQIDRTILEYAATFTLPMVRIDAPPSATWKLDGRPVARFTRAEQGPDRLEVGEVGLLEPLRKLRLGHVEVVQP